MKSVLVAAVALIALQVPAPAQAFGGGNQAGAVMGMALGALLGGSGLGRQNATGYGGYRGGYGQARFPAYGNNVLGNGGYGGRCRIVVRRGIDGWGNTVSVRRRQCI